MANNIDVKDAAAATVTMKTTDNAGVHTAHHNVDSLPALAAGTNNIGDVDILTVPAPLSTTGGGTEATALRVTVASDSTGVLSIDDNGSSITVDGTVAATQSGSWIISANSGVDIGDVTINNAAGASAVNIQDGGNSITVDGTVAATQSGTWNITNVSGTVSLPTGAATETTLASALTALQLIDNIVSGTGVNISQINGVTPLMGAGNTGTGALRVDLTSNGSGQVAAIGKANHDSVASGAPVLNGGYASAAAPANVSANGDVVRAWHLLNGAQATVLTAAGALIGGDATNGLDVDVTRLPALPAGTNNIGDVDVLSLPSIPAGTNNIGDVDVLSLPSATSGGAANVSSSATNVTLLASNASRKGFTIFNDSTQVLYVKFGATASTTSFHVKMAAGSYYESPAGVNYTGIIDGIWASANGSARVGEFT